MKKGFILLSLLLAINLLHGQIKLGVKLGAGTTSLEANDLNIFRQNGTDSLKLAIEEANLGFQGGLVLSIQLGAFIIQPEFLYSSNSTDFRATDENLLTTITKEKYQYLDIPLLVGCKFGPLRLMAGPEGHVFLDSTSGLFDLGGYKQDFENLTVGWLGGIGLDIWKLAFDFRYEGNLNNFGDHINFNDRQYKFDDKPSRFLFSVAFFF